MRLRRILDVAAGVALVSLASVGYHRVFDGWTFLVRFAGTAIVAAVLVALLTRGLLSRRWAVAVLVVGLLPVEMYFALGDTLVLGLPTTDTASALWDGLGHGWADALSSFLPLSDPSPVTVLLVAMVYAAAVVTTVLIMHTDGVLPPVLPSLVLYGFSLPLGAPAPDSRLLIVAALIAGVLGLVLLRANPVGTGGATQVARADADFQPRRRLGRVLLVGGPMIVLATLIGVGLGTLVGLGRTDDPFDPRDRRDEDVAEEAVIHPLDRFKDVIAQDPPVSAFVVSILGTGDLAEVPRVSYAAFDAYDGRVWSTTDRYERHDELLPEDASLRDDREQLTLSFERFDPDLGPYLPVVGRPNRIVDLSPVRFGEQSGTVLAPATLSAPVVMVVDVIRPGDAELGAVEAESNEIYDSLRTLPDGVSNTIAELAAEVSADADSAAQELQALREHLETQTRFDPAAPSGYSAGQVEAFLTGDQPGTQVHYATGMALMARALGFPARVVVGWELPPDLPPGTTTLEVTSADHAVWAEVRLADGLGWQALEVTPNDSGEPLEAAPGTTVPAGELGGVRPTPQQAAPGQILPEAEPESNSLSPWLVPVGLVGFALLWVVTFGALIMVSKRRRRRQRRRANTPTERIIGAWVDSGDRLVETGVGLHPRLTITEVVAAGGVRLGDETVDALREMLPAVGACAYAADAPTPEAADRAWDLADLFRRDLSSSRSMFRGVVAGLNPRPLLRNRGR